MYMLLLLHTHTLEQTNLFITYAEHNYSEQSQNKYV